MISAGDIDLAALEPEDRYSYFANATYCDLTRVADTPEARGLAAQLATDLQAHHLATGTWTNKRGAAAMARVAACVASFVGDLLTAPGAGRSGGLIYRSTQTNSFTKTPVSADSFRAVLTFLRQAGLVEHTPGFRVPPRWGEDTVQPGKKLAPRFRATPSLLAMAEAHGVVLEHAADHFAPPARPHLQPPKVALKSTKLRLPDGRVRSSAEMPYKSCPEMARIKADLDTICSFLASTEITGAAYRGFVRQFEHGDHPDFRWNQGGRLYTSGKDSYQQQKKAVRLAMRLNGERLVEIDIRASYLTILHAHLDAPLALNPDPYTLPGIPRDVVKTWVTASITKGSPVRKWSPRHKEDYAKEYPGRDLAVDHRAAAVEMAVGLKHPALRDIEGLGVSWADLMYRESQVIVATMLDLVAEGIPSLPVHDSLIVPQRAEEIAKGLLGGHFERIVDRTPELDVRRPPPPCGSTSSEMAPVMAAIPTEVSSPAR